MTTRNPAHSRRAVPWGSCVALILTVVLLSCKASSKPDDDADLSVQLDAVPALLKAADSIEVASIWATVWDKGAPAPDSTLVTFAATGGTVEAEGYTKDGLASVVFRPGPEAGYASVIAQVKGLRDTVLLTLY